MHSPYTHNSTARGAGGGRATSSLGVLRMRWKVGLILQEDRVKNSSLQSLLAQISSVGCLSRRTQPAVHRALPCLPSIYRWGRLGLRGSPCTSQGICFLKHSHGFPLGGNTLCTGGRTALMVMSCLIVSHPCPMAPSHSLEGFLSLSQPTECRQPHSQLTVTRKQKRSHEWPNAHVSRYRRYFLTL